MSNFKPAVFGEGLEYKRVSFLTWIRQFCRAILFLLDKRNRTVRVYKKKMKEGGGRAALCHNPDLVRRLISLSGAKYDVVVMPLKGGEEIDGYALDRSFSLSFCLLFASMVRDIFHFPLLDELVSSKRERELKAFSDFFSQVDCVQLDLLNDQTFFSRMCINATRRASLETHAFQHGLICSPEFYFPLNADFFHGYERRRIPDAGKRSFIMNTWIPAINYCALYRSSDVFVVTHSVFWDAYLTLYAFIDGKTVLCKPHPTAKFKFLYHFLDKFEGFTRVSELEDGFNSCSMLWTAYSSVALDAAFIGLKVRSFASKEKQPWFIKLAVSDDNAKTDFFSAMEEEIIF